jgi:hypothetical protein
LHEQHEGLPAYSGVEGGELAEGVRLLLIVTDASVFQDDFPDALVQVILVEVVAHKLEYVAGGSKVGIGLFYCSL